MKQIDVAIIGGGPAGMVAACLLARAGIKTLVLEKNKDFDREFRGEILQPRFQQAMKDVDLYDHLKTCPHEELDGAHIYFQGIRMGGFDAKWLDRRNPKIWWMTQPNLLNGLDQYARRFSDYELWFNIQLLELRSDKTVVVKREDRVVEIKAKVIIGADGRFSKVRQLGGFKTSYDIHDLDVVWFILNRPKDYNHFFSFFLGMGNVFLILPKHPNQLQCGMVFRPNQYNHTKKFGIEKFRKKLGQGHPAFSEFAKNLSDFSQFHPLKGNRALVEQWVKNGVVLIGDAAHTCSPVGGIGVSIAVETACVAAHVIKEGMRNGDLSDQYLENIQKLRLKQIRQVHRIQGQVRFFLNPVFWPFRIFIPLIASLATFFRILPLLASQILTQKESMPISYPDSWTVKDALEVYFKRSGFGRETYTDSWVRLPVGLFTMYLPNISPRKKVVPLHDVDHVVSEYSTDWTGEFEITAYELGTGLGKYWFGWIIDLQGIWPALLFHPLRAMRAFSRGRRSGCLYKQYRYDDALLSLTLGKLRKDLETFSKDKAKIQLSDVVAMAGMLVLSVGIHALFFVPAIVLIVFISR